MTDSLTDGDFAPIMCFLSYARKDNETFNSVADEIKARLTGLYEAKTGRTLNVFLDRDDIGWGEDWRDRIGESVRAASVFIPLITMRYFTRQNCREELMAFYASADFVGRYRSDSANYPRRLRKIVSQSCARGGAHCRTTSPRQRC